MSHRANRWRACVVVIGLSSGLACAVQAAQTTKAAVENKEVAGALTEAKKLAGKRQWEGALAAVRQARAVDEKSAYAAYKIDEFEAYLLTQQRQYSQAATVFERLAQSPDAPRESVAVHWKTAAQLYMQAKAYDKAEHASARALKYDAGDTTVLEMLGQSQYLAKNYRAAAATIQRLVNVSEREHKKPDEQWLQMQLASYDQLHDEKRVTAAWESLLKHYPKSEYWETVLAMKAQRSESEAIEAGYHRLMFDVGVLKKPSDYEDLALKSIDAGAPSEAVAVLEAGLANGALGGQYESRYRRMLDFAKQKVTERERNLAQLTAQSADLPARSSIELGRLHLGRGDYAKAIEELQRGLKATDLPNEDQSRIALGIAYLKNDQPTQAQRTFAAVEATSQWRDLAQLWSLRSANDAPPPDRARWDL